jgi:hypothetical protein
MVVTALMNAVVADGESDGDGDGDGDGHGHGHARALLRSASIRRMEDLRAGDQVLVMDETAGVVRTDRVSINLHLQDTGAEYGGVTFHHGKGQLSVTDEHVVILNGLPAPTHSARMGDRLRVVEWCSGGTTDTKGAKSHVVTIEHPQSIRCTGMTTAVTVTVAGISRWKGGIINPITHSGRILAATATSVVSAAAGQPAGAGAVFAGFTLATTVIDSPGQVQLVVTAAPSFLKLGSLLFPAQFQRSALVEES